MEITTSADFHRKLGKYQDRALIELVLITPNGRERLVLLSVEEFRRFKRWDCQVMGLEDFTEADVEALTKVQPSASAASFDHEVTE
jgi:hypothetical protein